MGSLREPARICRASVANKPLTAHCHASTAAHQNGSAPKNVLGSMRMGILRGFWYCAPCSTSKPDSGQGDAVRLPTALEHTRQAGHVTWAHLGVRARAEQRIAQRGRSHRHGCCWCCCRESNKRSGVPLHAIGQKERWLQRGLAAAAGERRRRQQQRQGAVRVGLQTLRVQLKFA